MKIHNPTAVPAASTYSHGVEVAPQARWLHISGQVGVGRDGKLRQGIEAQTHQVWENLAAVLASAGMTMADVVKVSTFLTREEDLDAYRKARASHLGAARPASTLLVVKRLADPGWLVEVEAIAAKA
jgi:enamine deaminase RidA (YjgF/YER057c/UK114 family)